MRPLTYFSTNGGIGGHYRVAHASGALAATIGAAGHLASIRWAPVGNPSMLLVLLGIRAGITISGAVTTAVATALQAVIVRGFSVDFTTASTATSMTGTVGTNRMRSNMLPSQMGTVGPRIATTAVMSGQTLTADAAPFAMATFANPSTTLGAAAVTNQVGAGTPMVDLFRWTGLGSHPPVLTNNEGIVVQPVVAGPASGTFNLYVEWEWAEVFAF